VSDDLSIPRPTYRIPRHSRGMDPATRRLALIAGGLGGLLLAIVGGWSMMGNRSTAVPVIQADDRPIRVKPENPGGLQIAGANDDALSGGVTGGDKLAPPPEVPAPLSLDASLPHAQPVALAPPALVTAPAKPIAAKPAAEKPAAPTERRSAAPAVERAVLGAKATQVQLAAVSSEEAARAEWQRIEKRMPELFGQRQPAFSKTERNGRTLWRLRTGGFSDTAQATAFCERVRAKGAGCSIADF
jgi:hypothetical protein